MTHKQINPWPNNQILPKQKIDEYVRFKENRFQVYLGNGVHRKIPLVNKKNAKGKRWTWTFQKYPVCHSLLKANIKKEIARK